MYSTNKMARQTAVEENLKLKNQKIRSGPLIAKASGCSVQVVPSKNMEQEYTHLPRYMWPTTSSSLKSAKKPGKTLSGQELTAPRKFLNHSRKDATKPVPVATSVKLTARALPAGRKAFGSRNVHDTTNQQGAREAEAKPGNEKPSAVSVETKENVGVNFIGPIEIPENTAIDLGVSVSDSSENKENVGVNFIGPIEIPEKTQIDLGVSDASENKENMGMTGINLMPPIDSTDKIDVRVSGLSSACYRNVVTFLSTETDDSPRDNLDETLADVSDGVFDSSVYFTPKVGGDSQIPDTPWTTLCNKFNKMELRQPEPDESED